jgi:hypothetical protein
LIINEEQLASVLSLSAQDRYRHFIKVVADWQEVWGLYSDGWALAATEEGDRAFPIWPAKEYAEACAGGEWSGYAPESFSLEEFMDSLLPKLTQDGVLLGVFYTPSDKGVVVPANFFAEDLKKELERY